MFSKIGQRKKVKALRDSINASSSSCQQPNQPIARLGQSGRGGLSSNMENEQSRQIRGMQVINRIEQIVKDYRSSEDAIWWTCLHPPNYLQEWSSFNPKGLRFLR